MHCFSKDECKTMGKILQEMQTKYKNVYQAHEQVQHDLKVVKEDKRNVDNEIVEAQVDLLFQRLI